MFGGTKTGAVIVNDVGCDIAFVTLGFTTVTAGVPAAVSNVEGITAVSAVADTNVVASGCPFHCTTSVETNPVPATFNVKVPEFIIADAGDRVDIVGAA
jgi:hypothetical protein